MGERDYVDLAELDRITTTIAQFEREIGAIEARLAGDRNAGASIFQRPEDNPRNTATITNAAGESVQVNVDGLALKEERQRRIEASLRMTEANIAIYENLIINTEKEIEFYKEYAAELARENEEIGAQMQDVPAGPAGDVEVRELGRRLEQNREEINNINTTTIPDLQQQSANYRENINRERENKVAIEKRKNFYAEQHKKYIAAENERDKERLTYLQEAIKDLRETQTKMTSPKPAPVEPDLTPSDNNVNLGDTPEPVEPENIVDDIEPDDLTPVNPDDTPQPVEPEDIDDINPDDLTDDEPDLTPGDNGVNPGDTTQPDQPESTQVMDVKKGSPLLRKAVGILAGVAVGVGLSFVLGPTGTVIVLAGNAILKGFIGKQIGLKEAEAMQACPVQNIEEPKKGIKGFCQKVKNYVTSVDGLKDMQNFLTGTSIGLVVGGMLNPGPVAAPTTPEPVTPDIIEGPHVIDTLYQTPTLQGGSGPLGYIVNPENGSFISEIKDGIATIVTPGFSGAGSVSGFVPIDALGPSANVGDLVTAAVNTIGKTI